MIAKTKEEIEGITESGRRLGAVLAALSKMVAPGVSTKDLDDFATKMIRDGGDEPSFLNYTPEGATRPYPAALCLSVNDEVVHGIPNEQPKILKEGDIVSLDLGVTHKGFVSDAAVTVPVGKISREAENLLATTEAALAAGVAAARVGNRIGDISHAIEETYKGTGFSIVKVLGGHGVGNHVHEEPFVPNIGHPGTGEEIVEGMVLALEPIATAGKGTVTIAADGYTYRTKDGSIAAHFEHTILIEKDGAKVLTKVS